jgi:hypothetical protein
MSKKLIAALLTLLVITTLVLSFYLEPLHAIVEGFLLTSLLTMLFYMVYRFIYGILTYNDDKKDYYL